jgi:hypothetical protein
MYLNSHAATYTKTEIPMTNKAKRKERENSSRALDVSRLAFEVSDPRGMPRL